MRNYILGYLAVFIIITCIIYLQEFDDTDDEANRERSGMTLYTDYGTGCQYLKSGMFDHMTPRLDASGNQVGCSDAK